MRVGMWKANDALRFEAKKAYKNATEVMDEVVKIAKVKCPIDPDTFRKGEFASATVTVTSKKGENKGQKVTFQTDNRWTGREPGDLRKTIRRTGFEDTGSIRVYAGNYKIYWAFMIERGYHDRAGKYHKPNAFLRKSMQQIKSKIIKKIQDGK